jgi:hypothetical protein
MPAVLWPVSSAKAQVLPYLFRAGNSREDQGLSWSSGRALPSIVLRRPESSAFFFTFLSRSDARVEHASPLAFLAKKFASEAFMPRYFFVVRGTAGEKDDPHGTILPNDAAALSYAERTIAELPKEEGYYDPGMIIIVRNHTHQMVWSIPFLPAYA